MSPQNSLQASLLHSSAAAAAAVSAASAAYSASPYFPFLNPPTGCDPKTLEGAKEAKPECSNVVSSTMEDDGDSSSREGLTPLTTVKVIIFILYFSLFEPKLFHVFIYSQKTKVSSMVLKKDTENHKFLKQKIVTK